VKILQYLDLAGCFGLGGCGVHAAAGGKPPLSAAEELKQSMLLSPAPEPDFVVCRGGRGRGRDGPSAGRGRGYGG